LYQQAAGAIFGQNNKMTEAFEKEENKDDLGATAFVVSIELNCASLSDLD